MLHISKTKNITSENMGIYSKYLPSLVLSAKNVIPGDVIRIDFKKNGLKSSQLRLDDHHIIVIEAEIKDGVWCISGIVANNDNLCDALNQLLLEIAGTYLEFSRYTAKKHGLKSTYIQKIAFFLSSVDAVKIFGRINFFENKRDLGMSKDELEIII